ncbi:hypothetical protein DFH08DRAFT_349470 [Mycena albidolilacea]|uniref:Uncharacterized protein n=1 Tax=Mycena albidolilacea TaxID=1033008 RepID=A0AAD6ZIK5_9AGAR|nr:hypothetical protein DFH08DRAFT_349470 [Mycena albidolilacea]
MAASPHRREAGSTRVVCSLPRHALRRAWWPSAPGAHRPSSSHHAPRRHTHLPYLSRCTAGDEYVPLSAPRRLDATRLRAPARYIADLRRSPTVVASLPLRSSSPSIPGSPPARLAPAQIYQMRIGTLGVCVRSWVRARRRRRVDRTPSSSLLASSSGTICAATAQSPHFDFHVVESHRRCPIGHDTGPLRAPGHRRARVVPQARHPVFVRLFWCGARSTVGGRRGRYGLPATSRQRVGSA